ncbi:MAG: hypothetical protein IJA44_06060 [Clostridia bacterium]|nr:hypothetical protein [Clostridia bacterium]
MKIDAKFKIEIINNQNVIIDTENQRVCGTVDFNDIKMFLWSLSQSREISKQQMLDEVLQKFEISTVLALGEIDTFIKKLKEFGIIYNEKK